MSLTNPTYDNLAQAAHALAGYGIILTAAHFGHTAEVIAFWLFITYAALKEFWFDMHYETPTVSGGWLGGLQDFMFYCVGAITGAIALWMMP